MEIRISLDRRKPPAGQVSVLTPESGSGPAQATVPCQLPFAGWLGLLRALDELLR